MQKSFSIIIHFYFRQHDPYKNTVKGTDREQKKKYRNIQVKHTNTEPHNKSTNNIYVKMIQNTRRKRTQTS